MTVLPGYRQGWDPLPEQAWVTHGLHSYRRLMVEHPDPASDNNVVKKTEEATAPNLQTRQAFGQQRMRDG